MSDLESLKEDLRKKVDKYQFEEEVRDNQNKYKNLLCYVLFLFKHVSTDLDEELKTDLIQNLKYSIRFNCELDCNDLPKVDKEF